MSDSSPDPEAVVPDELRAALEDQSSTVLRAVADYAAALAEDRARGQTADEVPERDDGVREQVDDGQEGETDAGRSRADDEPPEPESGDSRLDDSVGLADDSVGSADDSIGSAGESPAVAASECDSKATSRHREGTREVDDSERPEGVPGKASITVKEINDNRYYYWQWREGDDVKSEYHGPVDSSS